MRSIVAGVAVAIALAACRPPPPHAPGRSAGAAPIVVTIVIDQFAAWIADERLDKLPSDGGFARLRREGLYVRDMRFAHAATETGPGHAALYTGAIPRRNGIGANEIATPDGQLDPIVLDREAAIVGPTGTLKRPGASAHRLRGDTIADRLRAARPDALILSISLKDRAAIFGGGRRSTATLWYDSSSDQFVTATPFATALPAWAAKAGAPQAIAALRSDRWDLLDGAWVETNAATPDEQPGEGNLDRFGITFPHPLGPVGKPSRAFRATPFGDDAVLAVALAGIAAEWRPGRPTLLAISLSSNDYIGHVFGPDSWEAWDELLRLDRALGRFFADLDRRFGAERYAVVLSADHGSISLPELRGSARRWCKSGRADRWQRPCGSAGRINPEQLGEELERAAHGVLGDGKWVIGVPEPFVALTPAARALDPVRRAKLDRALSIALLAHSEVERVIDLRTLPAECPPLDDDSIPALVCRSSVDGANDYYVVVRPGSFIETVYVPGHGANHGSPYLYDRAVPLLVRAPGRAERSRVIDEPLPFSTFTHAVSALLGIAAPLRAAEAPTIVH